MHPVLFEVPLPRVAFSLGVAWVAVALACAATILFGRRARAMDLVVLGVVCTPLALLSAVRHWHDTAELAPMPFYGFGVCLCTALMAGWFLALAVADRDGLSREAIGGCYVVSAVAGLLGARLLYVITNTNEFSSLAGMLAFREGGLVFYGGILGGLVGSVAYARRRRVHFFAWADVAAPSLALGSLIGRMGCYLAGCDYGLPLGPAAPDWLKQLGTFPKWPDAVAGPGAGSPAWVDQVLYRGLSLDAIVSRPVHPTELYESIAAAGLLLAVIALRSRAVFRGQVFLSYIAGYAGLRFLLEILRADPERGFYGPMAAPSVLVPLGLSVLALSFVLGPASTWLGSRRLVARLVAGALPVVGYLTLRTSDLPHQAFSTSQWVALGSSVAAAVVFRRALPE